MTRRARDAAVLLFVASSVLHVAVLACRYLEARLLSSRLPACDVNRLIDVLYPPDLVEETTMQPAVNSFLDQLAALLGPLSPFTKAIVPAALALAVAIVNSLFAGAVDAVSITIAASGLVLALVTYLVPNKPAPVKPVPPPVPPAPPAAA